MARLTARARDALAALLAEKGLPPDLPIRIRLGATTPVESFVFEFGSQPGPEDACEESQGLRLVLDPAARARLETTEIDYLDDLLDRGFTFSSGSSGSCCDSEPPPRLEV